MTRAITPARLRALAAAAALIGLTACGELTGLAVVGAGVVSLSATKKLPLDHVASWVSGKDCSVVVQAETGRYCRDEADATQMVAAAPLYCYRTLGEITCYAAPDEQASASRRVQ